MDVKCEKCQARYRIDDGRVGPAGLTMRCGKCGNTFKVTRGGSTQAMTPGAPAGSAPPVAKPAPAAESAGQTMMFGVAPVPPAKPFPSAAKPFPSAAKPPPAAAKPPADDAAGRTMMFGAPPVQPQKPGPMASKPAPPRPAPKKPAPSTGSDDAGSTQMFAAAPIVAARTDLSKAAKAVAAPPQKPAPAAVEDEAGATMMFAGGPPVTPPSQPKVALPAPRAEPQMQAEPEPVTEAESEHPQQQQEDEPQHEQEAHAPSPISPMARAEPEFERGGVVAEGAESGVHTQGESLVPVPRKVPVVPIAIAASVIVLSLLALVAYKRFGKQLPAPATIDAIKEAHQTALKDTPVDYAAAETTAKSALEANKRAFYPVGYAELAEIEIAWGDALHDKAAPDTDIKARRTAASEALSKGLKQDGQNIDLMIAQADYYRSAGSTSSYAKAMKKASTLGAADPRVAFVQGLAAGADEEAPDKALPLLKQAAEALPDSARVRYRYAAALANSKQPDAAIKELNAVLKLSPAHERAKAMLEQENAKVPPPPAPPDPAADPKKKGK